MTDQTPERRPLDQVRGELLGRLTDGQLDLESPEVRTLLAADPGFAAEVQTLLDLDGELSALAEVDLDAVRATPEPWPGADAAVRRMVADELAPKQPGRRWWLPVLLAAAAITLVVIGTWREKDSPLPVAPPELLLGDAELWPRGPTDREQFGMRGFDWSEVADAPGVTTFTVVVRARDGRSWTSPPLRTHTWLPDPEVRAGLPDIVLWQVHATSPGRKPRTWQTEVLFH